MPKRIDEETKQQVVNLWLNHNYTQQKIANYLGIGYGTVHRVIKGYTTEGLHKPPKDMPMPAAQTDKPTVQAVQIPAIVLRSTAKMIARLNEEITAAEQRLNALRSDREELTAWLEEVKRNESTEA